MKPTILGIIIVIALASVAAPAAGQEAPNGDWNGTQLPPEETPTLPANGVWHYSRTRLDQEGPDGQGRWMQVPSQGDLWTIPPLANLLLLSVTDAWVTGDQFEVYIDGVNVLITNDVDDYSQPEINPDVPKGGTAVPFANQQRVTDAFASDRYSKGSVQVLSKEYAQTVNVKSTRYPSGLGAAGFGIKLEVDRTNAVEEGTWGRIKALFR